MWMLSLISYSWFMSHSSFPSNFFFGLDLLSPVTLKWKTKSYFIINIYSNGARDIYYSDCFYRVKSVFLVNIVSLAFGNWRKNWRNTGILLISLALSQT